MLLDLLSEYLNKVEARVLKLENVYVERYEEEIIANNRINLGIINNNIMDACKEALNIVFD